MGSDEGLGAKLNIEMSSPAVGILEAWSASKVIYSKNLAQGEKVAEFETRFSKQVLDREESTGVAVNSGTSGLILALMACGVGAGDEVIVPSFTFAATANAVVLVGAKPVFCDIDPNTFNIDANLIELLLTSRTRAIIPVHLYGNPAKMPEIMEIAHKHSLVVIEDAAQAHGATINKIPVGTFGTCGVFSFYPTKNMTTGEGGLVTSSEAEVLRKLRLLRNQGMEVRYQNEVAGFNNRMTDIAAAIGLVQLRKLPTLTSKRIKIAKKYSAQLRNVYTPSHDAESTHVFHQYTINCAELGRDRVLAKLQEAGIPSAIYYPTPVHRLPSFNLELELPNTMRASKNLLSIPMHPGLTERQTDFVIKTINSI